MAMTWGSLTAPKGTTGSIATWVSYTKLDLPPILDEAQSILYETLRTREMMTQATLRLVAGNSQVALPTGFLDPIGRIYCPTVNLEISHRDEAELQRDRSYETTSGTLASNPLTTTLGSALVSVNLPGHGFNQGSIFTIAAAAAVGGLTPNGTFPIASITDVNDFVVDTSILGAAATSAATGGGAAITYACENLIQTSPSRWAVWNEMIQFDGAFNVDTTCQLLHYRALPLLSVTNQTNFLTTRYPSLLRTACITQAADFMKDDAEYQKGLTRLQMLIARTNVENEGFRRGSEIYAETPYGG